MTMLQRNVRLIGFLLAMAIVFCSYYFQHIFNFRPCLLCTLQRGVFISLAIFFFLAFAHQYFRGAVRSYGIITALLSLIGIATASRQLWLQALPTQPNELCIPGVSYLFHQLPFLDAVKMIFTASQECGRVEWVFLHVSMAGWALLFFVIFFFLSIILGTRRD
jgi:disulfide bond formation protein DsbB